MTSPFSCRPSYFSIARAPFVIRSIPTWNLNSLQSLLHKRRLKKMSSGIWIHTFEILGLWNGGAAVLQKLDICAINWTMWMYTMFRLYFPEFLLVSIYIYIYHVSSRDIVMWYTKCLHQMMKTIVCWSTLPYIAEDLYANLYMTFILMHMQKVSIKETLY